jgi:hypothetical protein
MIYPVLVELLGHPGLLGSEFGQIQQMHVLVLVGE